MIPGIEAAGLPDHFIGALNPVSLEKLVQLRAKSCAAGYQICCITPVVGVIVAVNYEPDADSRPAIFDQETFEASIRTAG